MVSNIGSLRSLSYNMVSAVSSGGRNYLPVNPNQYVYSQFKYISGFPAKNGQQGVSIDRLVILNTLIDQLVTMKQKSVETADVDTGTMSDDQIDALIQQYQGEIHAATAVAETMDYKPLMPQTAMVIDLVA
ncbi:MAG TPA: hypothetical protein GXZ47_04200 [Treponema sp.]|nr:hypothetical protein [Treponema sp.]